jgi:glycosyltransferase involved in cell wall biosynthesis
MLSHKSKIVYPQIENVVSLKDVEYMSIGKVLFDIRNYCSLMTNNEDTEDTLIYFYNFNGFLLILDKFLNKLEHHNLNKNKISKVILFTVIEGDEIEFDNSDNFKKLINNYDFYLCPVSLYTKDIVTKWLNDLNIENVKTLYFPHCLDNRIFRNLPIENKDIKNIPGFKFFYVGNNSYRKNVTALIDAFTTEFKEDEDVKLILKINNIDDIRIKENENIIVIADVDDLILSDIYRTVDCCVFPSRCEGFGLPILESLMCGTPVIAPYHTGIKTICEDEDYLISVKFKDVKIPENKRNQITMGKGTWYDVDVDDLKLKMRDTFNKKPKLDMQHKLYDFVYRFSLMHKYGSLFNDLGRKTKHFINYIWGKNIDIGARLGGNIVDNRDNSILKMIRYFESLNRDKLEVFYNRQNSKLDILKSYFDVNYKFGSDYKTTLEKTLIENVNNFDIIYLDFDKPDFNYSHHNSIDLLKLVAGILYNIQKEVILCIDHNLVIRNKVIGNGQYVHELLDSLGFKAFNKDYLLCYKLNKYK